MSETCDSKCESCSGDCEDDSHIEQLAKDNDIGMYAKIPMNPIIAQACDNGEIESFKGDWLDSMASFIQDMGGI